MVRAATGAGPARMLAETVTGTIAGMGRCVGESPPAVHPWPRRRNRTRNVARQTKPPRGGNKREGQGLAQDELHALASACRGDLGEVLLVLGYTGLRWGELAGLQVGDRVAVPGFGTARPACAAHRQGRGTSTSTP
jgi:hypothetical protein